MPDRDEDIRRSLERLTDPTTDAPRPDALWQDLVVRRRKRRIRNGALTALPVLLVGVVVVGLASLSDSDDGRAEVATGTTASTVEPAAGPAGGDAVSVSEVEARAVFAQMVRVAAERTPEAMERLCGLTVLNEGCHGLSSGIVRYPQSAPDEEAPAPAVVCSRSVGDGAWMLVVEGQDGYGRPYVSQMVFDRGSDGMVGPLHEAGFWLGIAYNGTKVTGSTGLTAAYSAQEGVDVEGRSQEVLQRARAGCDRILGRWTALAYSAVVVPPPGVYLRFDEGGQLQGNDGCNDFTAEWEVTADHLVVDDFDSNGEACEVDIRLRELLLAKPSIGTFDGSAESLELRAGDEFIAFGRDS